MKTFFSLRRIFKLLAIVVFGLSCSQVTAQPLLCRGQVTYTYPDGKQSYAQYYLETHQRYAGDCFLTFCPAKCPFETAARPKKRKIINQNETEKAGAKKDASSK